KILAYNEILNENSAKNISYYKKPDDKGEIPFAPIQQGMYIQTNLDIEKYTYNIPIFIKIPEQNLNLLKSIIQTILIKHDIFRYCINGHFKFTRLNINEFDIAIHT